MGLPAEYANDGPSPSRLTPPIDEISRLKHVQTDRFIPRFIAMPGVNGAKTGGAKSRSRLGNERQVFHRFKSAYRPHIAKLFPAFDSVRRTRHVRNISSRPRFIQRELYEFITLRKGVVNTPP